jgi:hypothetical protein
MNKMDLLRGATELAVSVGVSIVVGNLIKETTPVDSNKFQRVMVGIGGYALGGLLGDMAGQKVVRQIDDLTERFSVLFNQNSDVIVVKESENTQTDEGNTENAA